MHTELKAKHAFFTWLTATLAVMLLLPCLAVTFVPASSGMVCAIVLFYAVNPLYSVLLGIACACKPKAFSLLPAISALAFLCGCGTCFGLSDPIFFLYAVIYLALGWGSMLVTRLLHRRRF